MHCSSVDGEHEHLAMKSYLSDFEMKGGWTKEDYIHCCTVNVKWGQEI
jgi:hypothetical protein